MSDSLVVQDYITYVIGEEVVGTVEATFDLTNLPPELHDRFVGHLQGKRVHIGGTAHLYWPDKYRDVLGELRAFREEEQARREAFPWWNWRRWIS